MLPKKETLPPSVVRELVDYDPATGVFTWKTDRPHRPAKAGERAGYVSKLGYHMLHLLGRNYFAHRVAWCWCYGEWPPLYVDHINGVRDDNRISNLRLATHSENASNRTVNRNSVTGVKGVKAVPGCKNKWMARIRKNGKSVYLGIYDSVAEASAAYASAAEKLHGDFARAA